MLLNCCTQLFCYCSITKSCSTLQSHGLQQAKHCSSSLSPGVFSNSRPLNWWCHPTISSSSPPSMPALNLFQHQSFPISWLFHQVANLCSFSPYKKEKKLRGFPGGSAGKESTCNAGDLGLIPGVGRSPGEGKSYPLQYSGLENSMYCIARGLQKVGHDWETFTHLLTHRL